jgi:hypothetical protein
MRLEHKRLGFNYRMTYVAPRARNQCEGLFRGEDWAAVRSIDPDEATQAFRITWPEIDVWPLVNPRTPRQTNWQCIRNACRLDVLHYDGELWWPYLASDFNGGFLKETLSAADCFEHIKTDIHLFEIPMVNDTYDVSKERPLIKTLIATDHDEMLALSQRKTSENFLICGDRAYVRGGLPVYFRNSHFKTITWEIDIASIGSDRRGDPAKHGLHNPPGSFQDPLTEQAFGSGAFWLPNEFEAAKSAAHRLQTKFPQIEILMPELISADLRRRIRLDSLFREVVRMFSYPFYHHWHSQPVWSFRKEFANLCDPVLEDRELTRRRLDILRAFANAIDDVSFWDMKRIRRDIISFDNPDLFDPNSAEALSIDDPPLSIDDLDALNSLAG